MQKKAAVDEGTSRVASLEQVSSAKWLTGRKGFRVDAACTTKQHSGVYFDLTHIDDNKATFSERSLGMWNPTVIETPVSALKNEWSIYKGNNLPEKIVGDLTKFKDPAACETARAKVWLALGELHEHHSGNITDLILLLYTSDARAARNIPKHQLVLVPATDSLVRLSIKKTPGSNNAVCDGLTIDIDQPPKPKGSDISTWPSSCMISPFWWIGHSSDKSLCNMGFCKKNQDGIEIKCLRNKRAVITFERLLFLKEKKGR